MFVIKEIRAIELLDSRGNPTVEAQVLLQSGHKGYGMVPSGASTGKREAVELRDQDQARYHGRGVLKAVAHVNNEIIAAARGQGYETQQDFDDFLCGLDGTENKSRLGANTTLACSLAFARACASANNLPLAHWLAKCVGSELTMPTPMVNVINGGMHADNDMDIQECMIVPVRDTTFAERVRMSAEVFHSLKQVLQAARLNTNVGDEGGFAPKRLRYLNDAIRYIAEAIEKSGYKLEEDFKISLDVAANSFYRKKSYHYQGQRPGFESKEMVKIYRNMVEGYPMLSLEDPLAEEDVAGWKLMTAELGDKVMLVGDDLLVTNAKIINEAAQQKMANAVIIKPNQVGTLTESWQAVQMARKVGYKVIVSHRSGETEDAAISHIASAWGVDYIKTGSMSRTDRVAKYNELIRLDEDFL